ncbi:MAG TPA: hypothetical protein VFA78_00540 [Chloroflexota bacterium]|nr:hypothetical protein [Chloroflexota bacterium]
MRYLHIPVGVGTTLSTSLALAVSALYWIVAGLIYWKKGREWIGLLTSFTLIELACLDLALPSYGAFPWPIQLANAIANIAIFPALILTFFTFPTGRFDPRWTVIPAAIAVALALVPNHAGLPEVLAGLVLAGMYLSAPAVQVYRYRHIYDPVERQQTKVFVFGLGLTILLLLITEGLGSVSSPLWRQIANGPIWLLIWTTLLLSISIPILRYRLWDIDILINRTLVYGSMTATLVATYVGLILLLQEVVRLITGGLSQQPLVIAVSTLAIAALIQPVRQYLQRTIDRRFYRRKYDAAKVVAAFSAALPHEVDLDDVRGHLIGVVHETVQPRFAGLWLRMADTGIEVLPAGSGPTAPANGE